MSTVFNHLLSHRSIRKFTEQDVSDEILNQILEAATMASSSGNMQTYSIILTRDLEMKKKMYEPHFKQSMLMDAPVFLTFCADFHRMRQWLKFSDAPDNFDNFMSFMIASIDAILASQNAVIAAESFGLGVCYMGTTLASAHEIGEILGCPENVVPVVGFALGYPDEKPKVRKRLPMSAVVHKEVYQDYSKAELLEIYKEKNEEGMKRYNMPEMENLAQIYTKVKYTKESHIKYSKDVLNYLESQKFM